MSASGELEFSFIGYKTQDIQVMNRTQIDLVMEDDAMMIGEVVAIGYGSQRKEDLSMAVTTVKVDDSARSRAADLGTLLQGRMPGVTVMQSGDPMQKASFTIAAAARRATTRVRIAEMTAPPPVTAYWWLSTVSPMPPTWLRISKPSPC